MKIYVKGRGRLGLRLPVPFWLIKIGLSETFIKLVTKNVTKEQRKYVDAIDFKLLSQSIGELKKYRGLALVDVKSHDGNEVRILI
jgi:hypothetical protein